MLIFLRFQSFRDKAILRERERDRPHLKGTKVEGTFRRVNISAAKPSNSETLPKILLHPIIKSKGERRYFKTVRTSA